MESRNLINKKYYESSKEHCSVCKIDVSKAGKAYHYSSKKHLSNMEKMSGEFNAVSMLEQALEKLKANPTGTKDICIDLINTLSKSLNYKQPTQEVVEKEVVVNTPKKIIKKKEVNINNCITNLENALTLVPPASDNIKEFVEKKWAEAVEKAEAQESKIWRKKDETKDNTTLVSYSFMRQWLDNEYLMDEDKVSYDDCQDITLIINSDCLFNEKDPELGEKHRKVILFCYWKIIKALPKKK
jgi:hypothetical protein